MITGPSWGPKPAAAPQQLVVLCHGLGADGHDLIDLAPQWAAALPHARFVSPDAPERRFGLLTACAHAFCIDCIRGWRARIDLPRETVRSCPVCRRTSFCVVPCARLLTDTARKAAAAASYERATSVIPCRYFEGGRGDCPFGSSCRYAHTLPDGSEKVYTRPALRLDGDGGVTVARATKLNEFFA